MSRSKTSPQPTKSLQVEFSGICTLVWNKKNNSAEVRLVDLASAGFPQHYAALGITAEEGVPLGVRGPNVDAAVSLPGVNTDVGIWNLTGSDIEIIGGLGKFSVDDSKVDSAKKPGKDAESIRWMPNLGELAESTRPNPMCPTAATVALSVGRVTAAAAGTSRKVEFVANGTPVGPPRYYLTRFKVSIPFGDEIALRLDRQRVLRINESRTVMISNTCMCGLNIGTVPDDFSAHYDLVEAKRRPLPQLAGPAPMWPSMPEFCWDAYIEI